MTVYQNARVYWEMFGGVNEAGQDNLYVRAVDMDISIGGWAAADADDFFQVSVYGRAELDGGNLETIYQAPLSRPAGATDWKSVSISADVTSTEVRCVVLKVELITNVFTAPDPSGETFTYADQYPQADAPPWGVRVHEVSVYGSPLGRDVHPHLIFADILDNAGFTYSGATASWTVDQLAFVDIPKDRQDALDDVNGLVGWNYACWDGTDVAFSAPSAGTARTVAADDPRTTWSVAESLDETYNAVRVCYANKRGKLREVIVHGDDVAGIGFVRADTLQAPESIKSEHAATRFGTRYLRSHEKKQVTGNLTISGYDGVLDPLLIRPGDTIRMTGPAKFLSGTHEVTRVTLRPLEWAADIEFGSNSRRFDTWLARLAAGARSIKRR